MLHVQQLGEQEIVAVDDLLAEPVRNEAEFALLIADSFRSRGLPTELLCRLVEICHSEHIERIVGYVLADNAAPILAVARRLVFKDKRERFHSMVQSTIDLVARAN